jgi:peptidoglycan/LPS O-acetylase OafA/YrhL
MPDARPSQLAYQPGLDGLRGASVLAIVFYHAPAVDLPGGFLGVSSFFTLSGFLITSLLVYEWEQRGRIDVPRFWERRFRRLMPAAIVALLGSALVGGLFGDSRQVGRLLGDGLAALFYVSNWRFIALGQDYVDVFASPSLVQHFWSLSIEEQFYLSFPLLAVVVLGRRGRLGLGILLGAVVVGATLLMDALFVPGTPTSRLYYGTDTRIPEILLGCLLGLWHAGRPPFGARAARIASVLGVIGLAATLWIWLNISMETTWLWQGGFSLYALITVAIIVSAVQPSGPVRALLAFRPLVWIGKVSYGTYLYHFPVFLTLTGPLTGLDRWPLFGLQMALSFALAAVSYYAFELPIRYGRSLTGWRVFVAVPGGLAAVAGALVLASANPPKPTMDLSTPRKDERLLEGDGLRVMVAGDSIAVTIGKGITRWAERTGRAAVYNVAIPGCGVGRGGRLPGTRDAKFCDAWSVHWAHRLVEFRPDVVFMHTGGWDLVGRQFPAWDEVHFIGEPIFDAWLLSELTEAARVLGSTGARVVWLTMPCRDHRRFLGMPSMAPERVLRLNELLESVASRADPGLELYDLFAKACPDGKFTQTLNGMQGARPDGFHFSDEVVDWLARELMAYAAAPATERAVDVDERRRN